ncbi:MAG: arsenite methyltransferase [Cyclobacteriaceae bacterium]
MKTNESIKNLVRRKYNKIANQEKEVNRSSCCGSGDCSGEIYNIMTDDYSAVEGYTSDADLGLGCGLPTAFAKIKQGDTVLDLGSGAGNDCFVARYETGSEGKVIGIDFAPSMLKKARENAAKLNFDNVEFLEGDIEDMPLPGESADVVISNCVLNLVPDKKKVFTEVFRVMKPGAHFSISDIVLQGDLPDKLRKSAEMYAGCVSGAIQMNEYLEIIRDSGFSDITIQKKKPIIIPRDILKRYLGEEEINRFESGDIGIFSISVFAVKPDNQFNPMG